MKSIKEALFSRKNIKHFNIDIEEFLTIDYLKNNPCTFVYSFYTGDEHFDYQNVAVCRSTGKTLNIRSIVWDDYHWRTNMFNKYEYRFNEKYFGDDFYFIFPPKALNIKDSIKVFILNDKNIIPWDFIEILEKYSNSYNIKDGEEVLDDVLDFAGDYIEL